VYTWGIGEDGQLGHGDYMSRSRPTKIQKLVPAAYQIVCGQSSTFMISNKGTFATGKNTFGQLGIGDNDSRFEPTLTFSTENVACGDGHTLFRLNGKVYSCGDNTSY
jgi:alpha-tubulin suppressor-like RCC1 family protein